MSTNQRCAFVPAAVAVQGLALVLILAPATLARADVVVISNRAKLPVRFKVITGESQSRQYSIAADDLVTLPTAGELTVAFTSGGKPQTQPLSQNSAYFFYDAGGRGHLQLREIKLPRPAEARAVDQPAAVARPEKMANNALLSDAGLLTIGVTLLVDEDERATRPRWEQRLRGRLRAASAVYERCARVRFEVVALDVWQSDNDLSEMEDSLREFETEVDPAPGKLAIGFSSQYEIPSGPVSLGGTHGALQSHVLLREWSRHVSESERMELLVHELGHYLGAVHSPELNSAMRPVLGDKQAVARQFRVGLDPLNALAVCLVADELRSRPIRALPELSPRTRRRLADVYTMLGKVLPDDPAAPEFLALVDPHAAPIRDVDGPLAPPVLPRKNAVAGGVGKGRQAQVPPLPDLPLAPIAIAPPSAGLTDRQRLIQATREVLRATVASADDNHRLPEGPQAAHEDLYRRSDDRLMEYYVSVAALAASRQPTQYQQQSFFLALAMAVDASHWLRALPVLGEFLREIEPDVERAHRLELVGLPSLRGRHDLAQHFFVSAAIASLAGRQAAETTALAKELRDADGGSGFSFSDWAADLAGMAMAEKIGSGELPLGRLARRFRATDYMPRVEDLPEGLMRKDFQQRFGSTTDERFKTLDEELRKQVASLRAHQTP